MKAGKEHIEDVIKWFEMVCNGIRQEYENGASHRNLERDKCTLESELYRFVE